MKTASLCLLVCAACASGPKAQPRAAPPAADTRPVNPPAALTPSANAEHSTPEVADGIHYGDPWARPPKVEIPPGWVEHQTRNPHPSLAYLLADLLLEASGRDVIRVGSPRPTIISHQMAIPLTAMYDAWAAYDDKAVGTRFGGKLRRPANERTAANRERAIATAFFHALRAEMPGDDEWMDAQMRKLGFDPANKSIDRTTPEGIGNTVAAALLEYRRHDGSNQYGDEAGSNGKPYSDYTYYEPRNSISSNVEPDRWQQIPFDDGKGGKTWPNFLTPHWYRVKPFALERSDQFRPGPQPKVGSEQLRKDVEEVIAFNGGLSLEQKSLVEFMREGPRSTGQSGHWLLFAEDVSRRDHYDLDRDVKLFFTVSNTAMDAFIACWDAKRFYDSARPYALVRVVQQLFAGKQIQGYLGPGKGFGRILASQWIPYSPGAFVTPPFPGYVSGHSSVSGASAKILELFTGSDRFGSWHRHTAGMFTEPDATVEEMQAVNGVKPANLPANKEVILMMPTFTATAEMAGVSRIMGGYHIQADNIAALKLGRDLAQYEWPRYQAYFDGRAAGPAQ